MRALGGGLCDESASTLVLESKSRRERRRLTVDLGLGVSDLFLGESLFLAGLSGLASSTTLQKTHHIASDSADDVVNLCGNLVRLGGSVLSDVS